MRQTETTRNTPSVATAAFFVGQTRRRTKSEGQQSVDLVADDHTRGAPSTDGGVGDDVDEGVVGTGGYVSVISARVKSERMLSTVVQHTAVL